MHHILCRVFLAKHQITQVTQSSYSPDVAPCNFWLFPKLKSPLKRKRFLNEIQENTTGWLIAIGRTVWGPRVPTLKGTEASLSYVQCFLHRVSSLSESILHITWLDTFWRYTHTHIHIFIHPSIDRHIGCFYTLPKQCCKEHGDTDISSIFCFYLLWMYTQNWNCWFMLKFYFNFFRNFYSIFHNGWTNLHSHQLCPRLFFSLPSSPTLGLYFLLDDSHSNRYEVIAHWSSDFHFLND